MQRQLAFIVLGTLASACPQRPTTNGAQETAKASTATSQVSEPKLATGRVVFLTEKGEIPIRVEIVDTYSTRQRGLMYRKSLAPDAGMLFIFPRTDVHSFWMRNTYVALDMIFLDESRVVVGVVENATPQTDSPRTISKPARYVVEVNAHLASVNGIVEGARARFEGVSSRLLAERTP